MFFLDVSSIYIEYNFAHWILPFIEKKQHPSKIILDFGFQAIKQRECQKAFLWGGMLGNTHLEAIKMKQNDSSPLLRPIWVDT